MRASPKLWGLLVVAGATTAGCTTLLGDFSSGGGPDASTDATGTSSGGSSGGGTGQDGGPDATQTQTMPDAGGDVVQANDAGEGGSVCTLGAQCSPGACLSGVTVCQGGGSTCIAEGTLFNGTACDAGAVCDNGACIACQVGSSCAAAGSCQMATIACSSGNPTCIPGGNAPNGQSCGTSVYCNAGSCGACTPGAACVPLVNPCHIGSAACVEGGISCNDLDASAAPGTACGTNQVCDDAGTCENCTANAACNPGGNLCQSGTTSCASGASTCQNPVNVANGTPCGTNQVCDNGICLACASNTVCSPNNNSCLIGYISCASGTSVCTQSGVATNGTACGSGQVCANGTCGTCTTGATCNPSGNVCQTGTTDCSSGSSTCTNAANVANGTACGTNLVCSGGSCVSCTAGVACNPGGNVCLAGQTSCATGTSVCVSAGNAANGITCATNEVCDNGACVACTAGVACNPNGSACQTGATTCSTGSSTCSFTANTSAGTSCGSNQVCDGNGNCIACTSGQACHPGGNACQTGTTTCSTGGSTCGGTTTNVGAGASCGSNQVCDGNGNCVACTSGTACAPSACQTGLTSCATGTSACTASVNNVNNGTSCGSGMVCDIGQCTSCTTGTACMVSSCQTGTTSCATGVSACTSNVANVNNGTSCGSGMVCNGGSCVACTTGATCNISSCQTGMTSCTSGVLACAGPAANVGAGQSCGTNEVCDGNGNCVSCNAGATCNPTACTQGTISCTTGAAVCANVADLKAGTSCGTNMYCDGNGNCDSCTPGVACNPGGNVCESATTSCATGTSACNVGLTYAANGTSCGTNMYCNGSGVCAAGCTLTLANSPIGEGELYTTDGALYCGGSSCSTIYPCGATVTVNPSSLDYLDTDLSDTAGYCNAYAPCTFTLSESDTITAAWLTDFWDTSYSVSGAAAYSNNNLTVNIPSTAAGTIAATDYAIYDYEGTTVPEKLYWEIHVDKSCAATADCGALGIMEGSTAANGEGSGTTAEYLGYSGSNSFGFGYGCCAGIYNGFTNVTVNTSTPASYGLAVGNTYMFAIDMAEGYLWLGLNGVWLSGNPATETSPTLQGAGLTGGTTYSSFGSGADNLHAAVFGYGSRQAATTVQFTGHFSASTYTYTPPNGF